MCVCVRVCVCVCECVCVYKSPAQVVHTNIILRGDVDAIINCTEYDEYFTENNTHMQSDKGD